MNNASRFLLLALCGTSTLAWGQLAASGEKWRVTSSMQMEGMSMPGSTNEICKAAGNQDAPIPADKNCTTYDTKRSGNTQSFKMRCTGKDAMEGSGEITYLGPDHYKGSMKVNAQGAQMTMNYEGQKLGACDGGEINTKARQMVEQSQQQMAQLTREQCREAAKSAAMPSMMANCKDPQDIKTYCTNFQTHKSFLSQADMQRMYAQQGQAAQPGATPLNDSARLCGTGVEKVRANLCSTAENSGQLDFLVKECSAQAAELANAQCAGRRYTAVNEKYRNFCSNYTNLMVQSGDENAPASPDNSKDKTKGLFGKGKKALGGLFGN
ncbi:MAG: DUF3617 domain-containing protein [Steroidobacteraceae bacterium]